MRTRLEKLLSDARDPMPEPTSEAGERAFGAALSARRGTRRRGAGGAGFLSRSVTSLAAAVALIALGGALGLALAPAGTRAAPTFAPAGPGFLPAAGWNTVAAGRGDGRVTATAANVVFVDPVSIGSFPRRTLASLPRRGILIVASFSPRAPSGGAAFSARSLPLTLGDATVTPSREGVRHRIRATAAGYWIDVSAYFAAPPSTALRTLANGQLARLVVPPLTIGTRSATDPSTGRPATFLVGRLASGARGERVSVLTRDCGARGRGFTLDGDERTGAGGTWQFGPVRGPAHYRARWRNTLSRPILLRGDLTLQYFLSGRSVVASVDTRGVGQNMRGRVIELQRRVGERWVVVKRARLQRERGGILRARFRGTPTEATLRVYAPARTAAPCFRPVATDPWLATARKQITLGASYGGPQGPRQLVLSGRIASPMAGEAVVLEVMGCGPTNRGWQWIVGMSSGETTRTTAGGAWRWVHTESRLPGPAYFRARWHPHFSDVLLVRSPLEPRLTLRRGVARVVVDTAVTGQRMARRPVELQRQVGQRWVRVATARFERVGTHLYAARFAVRRPGLTLRAFVPTGSARPCYLPGPTGARRS